MMLATTIQHLRPEMITEMGSEMEMVEEDIGEAEETAAEEIKMGKDQATEEMVGTEDLNVEWEIIEMNIMEEEVVDVVVALAKETKGEAVVKIDQEVIGEVKTSEEKRGQIWEAGAKVVEEELQCQMALLNKRSIRYHF